MSQKRRTPKNVETVVYKALEWLPSCLDEADREFASQLVAQLEAQREGKPSTRIYPTLSDCQGGKPKPEYLVDDVVTFDLRKAYKLRFENLGKDAGRLQPLRDLLRDPKRWLFAQAHERMGAGKRLTTFLSVLEKVFPVGQPEVCAQNTKLFYTRFYGNCTQKGAGKRGRGVMHNVGVAARLLNTLFVVEKESELREGSGDAAVLMVQTDSITVKKSALKDHPKYGVSVWTRLKGVRSGMPGWTNWVAQQMSLPGVAEWKVESEPTTAILRGLAGKYAYRTVKWTLLEDSHSGERKRVSAGTEWKISPSNMLDGELKDATELDSDTARRVLERAFDEGPRAFAELVQELPVRITKKTKKNQTYTQRPSLRTLLSSFVESAPSGSASSSKQRQTASERAMQKAKQTTEESGQHHFVVSYEFPSSKREFRQKKLGERHTVAGQPYHEMFAGLQRAFVDYDDEKTPLPAEILESSAASLVRFWKEQHGIDANVCAYVMSRESPVPAVPSFKRHIVFHVLDRATGKEAVFADPSDIPQALGENTMKFVDTQPYAWKHELRMPGCPGAMGSTPYLPHSTMKSEDQNLNDPEVYAKYCVCVDSENKIVHGTRPQGRHMAGSCLMFKSEKHIASLVEKAIVEMCPDHAVSVGASGFDQMDSDARTVWQRISVKSQTGSNVGGLLDLTFFSEKVLLPVLNGGSRAPWDPSSHKRSNNSFLNLKFVSKSKFAPGYFGQVQFKVKGAQRKGMWNMRILDLSMYNLSALAREANVNSAQWTATHTTLLQGEKQRRFRLASMTQGGACESRVRDVYEIRNALRRRIRAMRIRRALSRPLKRYRSGDSKLEEAQKERLKYWNKNIAKVDNPEDIGIALGYVVSCCEEATARKAIEVEANHVAATQPGWRKGFEVFIDMLQGSMMLAESESESAESAERERLEHPVLKQWVQNTYA